MNKTGFPKGTADAVARNSVPARANAPEQAGLEGRAETTIRGEQVLFYNAVGQRPAQNMDAIRRSEIRDLKASEQLC